MKYRVTFCVLGEKFATMYDTLESALEYMRILTGNGCDFTLECI